MGMIIYKPHCSKCGALINQQIICSKETVGEPTTHLYYSKNSISPYRCKCCGEIFDVIQITIPGEESENKK